MKNFFQSTGFKVLLGVIFILFGVMLYTASAGGSIFSEALGFVTASMQKVTTVVTNNAAVTAENVTVSKEELQAENAALRKQIEELNAQLIDYYQVKLENEQFRSVLELKQENRDFQFVSAAVIGRDPNDLFYSFYIEKGSNSGISVNDPVITNAGIVGWVSSVTASYSKVTTILSPDTSIAAVNKVTRESGAVNSDLLYAEDGTVKLCYLSADTQTKAGDIIVTSGLGGIYPKDLPIGKVLDVGPEEYDVSYSATVQPMVDVKTVRDVFVITDFEGQGEVLEDFTGAMNSLDVQEDE